MGIVSRNYVKTLGRDFSDMKAGDRMLISSPEEIAEFIRQIPFGKTVAPKEIRRDLARKHGADNTCPVSTGLFLRVAVEDALNESEIKDTSLPFWRVVDEKHPLLRKLGICRAEIARMRQKENSQS